jgi:hypothetical protein
MQQLLWNRVQVLFVHIIVKDVPVGRDTNETRALFSTAFRTFTQFSERHGLSTSMHTLDLDNY